MSKEGRQSAIKAMPVRLGGRIMLSAPGKKAKNFKGTIMRLLQYLRPHSFSLLIVFALAVCGTVFSILGPKILGRATTLFFNGMMDRLRGVPDAGIDFELVGKIMLLLTGIYILSEAFNYLGQFIMAGVVQKIVYTMREEVYQKLTRLPLKFFDTYTHGEILSRVTNDMDLIGSTLGQSLTHLISSLVTVAGVMAMMLIISPAMTLIALLTLPLWYLITTKITRYSQKMFVDQQRELGELNSHIEEAYGGHIIVKSFGNEEKVIQRFKEINERLYDAGWRALFISGIIMPLINFVNNMGYVLVCIVGAVFVIQGRIAIGDMQAFIQYSRNFKEPIIQFANVANIIQATIAAAERVFELLDEEEEKADSPHALTLFAPRAK